jgi:dihydropteroate synthase
MKRPEIWGVLNVTEDSFSDGGRFLQLDAALAHAKRLLEEGADVIDVGGASSRPAGATYGAGAPEIPVEEEAARVVPVIAALHAQGARVSVDTSRAEVARVAIAAGASIVNDVTMGRSDDLLAEVARGGAALVLMHSRADGRVDRSTTEYGDLVSDVIAELEHAAQRAMRLGVPSAKIWVDPGIGFAKTPAQSAQLIGATRRFVELGRPVLVGASRKSFIGALAPCADGRAPEPEARLGGSIAAVTAAILGGAQAVRVHDVAESRQAALVAVAMAAVAEGPLHRASKEAADARPR